MRIFIEPFSEKGFSTKYRLKLLDGCRAGQFVRMSGSEPLFAFDRPRLGTWARDTGYEVVSNRVRFGKADTPADLRVFRAKQGETKWQTAKLCGSSKSV